MPCDVTRQHPLPVDQTQQSVLYPLHHKLHDRIVKGYSEEAVPPPPPHQNGLFEDVSRIVDSVM